MKAKDVLMWGGAILLIVLALAVVLLMTGVIKFSTASGGGMGGDGLTSTGECGLYGNTQSWTLSTVDFVNKGNTVTASYSGKYNDGLTIAAQPGATAVNTNGQSAYDLIVNASGYYNAHAVGTTDCNRNSHGGAELAQQGTIKTTVYYKNTEVTSAAPIEVGTNDPIEVTAEFEVNQSDRAFSNPSDEGFMKLLFNFNESCWDKGTLQVEDGVLDSAPTFATGFEAAFKVPKTLYRVKSTQYQKSGAAVTQGRWKPAIYMSPLDGYDCSDQNVTVRDIDADYYTQTKTAEILFGDMNNLGADVGKTTTESFTIYVK